MIENTVTPADHVPAVIGEIPPAANYPSLPKPVNTVKARICNVSRRFEDPLVSLHRQTLANQFTPSSVPAIESSEGIPALSAFRPFDGGSRLK